jgi:pimeloyl-ACP methyl ester carboxylesterase
LSGASIAPALLLLPGIDGTGKFLREFANALRPSVEPIIVPYPLDRALGYDELEALVLAALPSERPYILLGESFSGPLAVRIAARSPPGLLAVILCTTFAGNPFPWTRWLRPLAALLPLKALPRWVRAPLMWGSASPRRAPAQADRAIAGVAPAVIRHRIAALLAVDESPALARIRVPTLVMIGRHDRVISRAATRRMLVGLPEARLAEIDGPHLLLQSHPAECAAAVLEFMREALPNVPAAQRS